MGKSHRSDQFRKSGFCDLRYCRNAYGDESHGAGVDDSVLRDDKQLGMVSPKDLQQTPLNLDPSPEPLDVNDYVDRSRRMHRNDL
ncbi:hypothetical protein [Shimia haliotis]|nr:hypothetical protein [Shimia haliotis]